MPVDFLKHAKKSLDLSNIDPIMLVSFGKIASCPRNIPSHLDELKQREKSFI